MTNKKMLLNEKGQFEVFRLLIGAVLGLAILVIVLGIVSAVEQEKFRLSGVRFDDGFETAVNLPTGETVIQKDLFFKSGEIVSSTALSQEFNVEPDCIEFFSSNTHAVVFDGGRGIELIGTVHTDIFFDCKHDVAGCFPYCRISFGQELP